MLAEMDILNSRKYQSMRPKKIKTPNWQPDHTDPYNGKRKGQRVAAQPTVWGYITKIDKKIYKHLSSTPNDTAICRARCNKKIIS